MNAFDEIIDRTGTNCAKVDEMNRKYGSDKLHFAVADMDFRSPEPILEAMRRVVEHGVFGYTILPEEYPVWAADWMKNRYGCQAEPDWVVFTPRINMGLNMAVETLTKPGDRILVHSPAYPALTSAVLNYGRTLAESPLVLRDGRWEMDFQQMESLADDSLRMVILCNPQNPTGRVWTGEELRRLGDFCVRHGLLLLSDDIHADIVRVPGSYQPAWKADPRLQERTILFNSVTKTFNVPGVILANMILPNPKLREQMKRTVDRWGLHNPNIFAAAVLEAAYTRCGSWVEEVNRYLWGNQDLVLRFFREKLPLFDPGRPEGTYLSWIGFRRTGMTPEEAEDFFTNQAGVTVYPGSHFGSRWENYIRLNAAAARPLLQEALDRMAAAYRSRFSEN